MSLLLINPNLCRQRYAIYCWICCFSNQVDLRHRNIETIRTKRKFLKIIWKIDEIYLNASVGKCITYICLEYIENSRFSVADIVFILNGLFDMRLYKLIQFIAILICIGTRCNFGHQNDQQKAKELHTKYETRKNQLKFRIYIVCSVELCVCVTCTNLWETLHTYRNQHALGFFECTATSQKCNDQC